MGCGSSLPNIPYDERTQDVFESGVDPNGERKRKKKGNKRLFHANEFGNNGNVNGRGVEYNVNVPKKKQKKDKIMYNNNNNYSNTN